MHVVIAFLLLTPICTADVSLDEIFTRYGTDKQSGYHSYVHAYSMLLGPWRNHIGALLEVGIGTVRPGFANNMGGHARLATNYTPGASLHSWREYLPYTRIVGLDLDAEAVRAAANPSQNIEAYAVDTTRESSVAALDLTRGGTSLFDVIIDDGLHTWIGQQKTLVSLWPLLRPGGFYFIEDVLWGDLTKTAQEGRPNPVMEETGPQALAILREGGAYSIGLDAFWRTLERRRWSTIIALQKPEAHWPRLRDANKGVYDGEQQQHHHGGHHH
jgi:SAM-dependent methyltransferase